MVSLMAWGTLSGFQMRFACCLCGGALGWRWFCSYLGRWLRCLSWLLLRERERFTPLGDGDRLRRGDLERLALEGEAERLAGGGDLKRLARGGDLDLLLLRGE